MSKNPGDSAESLANELSRLRAERDAYKAVLIGAEYRNVDELPYMGIEFCTLLGEGARNSTLLLKDDLKRAVHCIKVILDHADGDERLEVSLHLDIARQIVDEIENEINN